MSLIVILDDRVTNRNIFAKLALPAIALLLIILSGRASGSLVGASIVGIVILAAATARSRRTEVMVRVSNRRKLS